MRRGDRCRDRVLQGTEERSLQNEAPRHVSPPWKLGRQKGALRCLAYPDQSILPLRVEEQQPAFGDGHRQLQRLRRDSDGDQERQQKRRMCELTRHGCGWGNETCDPGICAGRVPRGGLWGKPVDRNVEKSAGWQCSSRRLLYSGISSPDR